MSETDYEGQLNYVLNSKLIKGGFIFLIGIIVTLVTVLWYKIDSDINKLNENDKSQDLILTSQVGHLEIINDTVNSNNAKLDKISSGFSLELDRATGRIDTVVSNLETRLKGVIEEVESRLAVSIGNLNQDREADRTNIDQIGENVASLNARTSSLEISQEDIRQIERSIRNDMSRLEELANTARDAARAASLAAEDGQKNVGEISTIAVRLRENSSPVCRDLAKHDAQPMREIDPLKLQDFTELSRSDVTELISSGSACNRSFLFIGAQKNHVEDVVREQIEKLSAERGMIEVWQ